MVDKAIWLHHTLSKYKKNCMLLLDDSNNFFIQIFLLFYFTLKGGSNGIRGFRITF